MIRALADQDLPAVMQIWHKTNIQAHNFLPAAYWTGHYGAVQAEGREPETGELVLTMAWRR